MQNLFPQEKITLNLPDTNIQFYPNFFSKEKADELFDLLYKNTPWQQDTITVYGKNHLEPRLTALYGIDHARTLAIITPSHYRFHFETKKQKLAQFAECVFDVREGTIEEKAKLGL